MRSGDLLKIPLSISAMKVTFGTKETLGPETFIESVRWISRVTEEKHRADPARKKTAARHVSD